MSKKLLGLGLGLGGVTIILGAFASHGLTKHLTESQILTFETGVRYQMYQAFFLILMSFIKELSSKSKSVVLWLNVFGVLFFSGSIYGLSTNALTGFDFTEIALITPLGGSLLIFSWFYVLFQVIKKRK
ncbi:MAG: DUF423 domain-containing protein [Psychroflexus halocasei]|uniref:DUF423 domain-containing protein n=1 Tax=Psychroflexus sp. S27 TaxID=1982757 RepID=UPI000C29AF15|nr:DUF423 domain-containing protein [Psychroflexus sp. S27]PJX22718.1 hypothetical protein CAP47_06715 [Psychroflexus sp. S27]